MTEERLIDKDETETEEIKEETQIEKLAAAFKELEESRMRMAADLENYKKRAAKERETLIKYANEDILSSLLTVMDNFELAIGAIEIGENNGIFKGVEMIYAQLKEILNKYGVEEINCLNKPFNPQWHEAVAVEERSDVDKNVVVEVFRKGYKFKDRVLRPSMVKVSK